MFESIAFLLMILWAIGLATSHTMGGFVHILLVLAVFIVVVSLVRGRRMVDRP